MTIVAQLSDIHINSDEPDDSVALNGLRAAVSALLALPALPDCVVLSGDLTEHGRAAEYAKLRAELAPLTMPIHPVPGNHDDRDALRAAFADHPQVAATSGPIHYVVDAESPTAAEPVQSKRSETLGRISLVCMDSTIPGEPGGTLADERLGVLESALSAAPRTPTIVAMHHPPFPIGNPWIDGMGHAEAGRLAEVIRRHPQVVRIIAGHVHRGSLAAFAGTVAVTCPSTYRQLHLDLRPDISSGGLSGEPPGFAMHIFPNGRAPRGRAPRAIQHSEHSEPSLVTHFQSV